MLLRQHIGAKTKNPNLARYCHFKGFTEFDSIHTEDFASDAQRSKSCASTNSATQARKEDYHDLKTTSKLTN
jgi:hypothetical protein